MAKFPSSAQRRVARPLIARHGGTHMVDLAVSGETAAAGMEEVYSYEEDDGDRKTTYRPRRGDDESPGAPLHSFGYGHGEVVVTECDREDDDAYLSDDVQPEPSEADGEEQNMGGAQVEKARGSRSAGVANARYSRRSGGIG